MADDFDSYDRDDIQYSDDHDGFGQNTTGKSTMVQNQPHDEEVALSDTESFGGRDEPPNVRDASLIESHDDDMGPSGPSQYTEQTAKSQYAGQEAPPARLGAMSQGDTSGSGAGDDVPGAYNMAEYRHLNVGDDIRELFSLIGRYKPHEKELPTKLKPFIPDYIPAIGGIDEFIKVPRPDGKPDFLGLKVLDEPAARQSDPTVLTLQLRQLSKEAPGNKAEMIGRIEHQDENKVKKITQWITSINDIHKDKPAANVSYSRRMPDIEQLMQEWPSEMETFLKTMKMPTGDLDMDLKSLTKLICSVMDIPVYANPVESLHVLFTLYLEFKSNPIFKNMMAGLDGGDPRHLGGAATPSDNMSRQGDRSGGGAAPSWAAAPRGVTSAGSMGMGPMGMGMGGANVMTFN